MNTAIKLIDDMIQELQKEAEHALFISDNLSWIVNGEQIFGLKILKARIQIANKELENE